MVVSVAQEPNGHHRVYRGDWAFDIVPIGDTTAKVFVAVDEVRDPRLSTRVVDVGYACGSYRPFDDDPANGGSHFARLARGGRKVVVAVLYDYGTPEEREIGRITYAHLDNAMPMGEQDSEIARWGGVLGTVGNYTTVECSGSGSVLDRSASSRRGRFLSHVLLARADVAGATRRPARRRLRRLSRRERRRRLRVPQRDLTLRALR